MRVSSKVFVGPSRANGRRRMMALAGKSHFLSSLKMKDRARSKGPKVKRVGWYLCQKLQKAESHHRHNDYFEDNKSRKHDAGKLTITSLQPSDTTSLNRDTIK